MDRLLPDPSLRGLSLLTLLKLPPPMEGDLSGGSLVAFPMRRVPARGEEEERMETVTRGSVRGGGVPLGLWAFPVKRG